VSKSICSHLEAQLPQMRDGDPPRYVPSDIAARSSVSFFDTIHPKFSLPQFQTLLRNYGFVDQWDIDLLTARYFYRMSYRQIQRDYDYAGKTTVERRLKHLHALLIERGFEQELK
jgi:hypothetical protein